MRELIAALVGVALVTTAAPALATSDDLREENRAFILEHLDDYDPDEVVEVRLNGDTHQMTQAEAIDHALDMIGDQDIERIATAAAPADHETRDWVGDLLHLGIGGADCGTQTQLAESTPGADVDPQFELHDGPVLYTTGTNADRLHVVHSDTMKEGHLVGEIGWTGKATSFCVPGFLVLDRIDGLATDDGLPEDVHDLPG